MKTKLKIYLLIVLLSATINNAFATASVKKPPRVSNATSVEAAVNINEFSFAYWTRLFTWYRN